MATTSNKKMASPSPITDIPDHLLAEIFLRLPAPEDLARTSATCVTFRRLLADGSFRRRLRLLHAPPLLGILDRDGFQPALPPHPSASAARALAHAAEFSFSFLPTSRRRWTVQDVRDGRVLLASNVGKHGQPPDLAVCDPLHRRYVLLPPLPHGLAASLQHWFPRVSELCWKRFLVPLGEEEAAAGDTAFRVILMTHRKTSLAAFYFSSSTDQWQATSMGLNDLALGKRDMVEMSSLKPYAHRRHYAYGCFYWDWVNFRMKKLLVLDTTKMEFSTADLPQGKWSKEGIAIVEAGEGRLGVFGFHGSHASDLSYTVARNKGESPSQWQIEKTISLDSGYKYSIRDATQRYLLLTRIEASSLENPLVGYFSMDIKTLQLQRLYEKQHNSKYQTYTYINFPPSLLSSRRI